MKYDAFYESQLVGHCNQYHNATLLTVSSVQLTFVRDWYFK